MSKKFKSIISWTLITLVLIVFSLAIWFGGPLLAFREYAPLEGFWTRASIVSLCWFVFLGTAGFKYWRKRKAEKALEAAVAGDQKVEGDEKELSARLNDALATLRKASGGKNYLYDLPWYVIIGPPGVGKTTALVNSGIKFPLVAASGTSVLGGIGGTRYCDWMFAEDAVLIDTAGRYTVQDSDEKADSASWLSFLSLLKTNRPKQPINGVIIALSLEDLMKLSDQEIEQHSVAIRKRLLELYEQLKVDFPVYALFTKADLVVGFNEFFGAFSEDRRRQVWGATFQTEDRKKNCIDQIDGEFDALIKRLTEETPDQLQAEPGSMSRIAIFGFPTQMTALKVPVARLLKAIFEPTRYHANAHLRGFYFSSGTQLGTPFDQVLGELGESFNTDTSSQLGGRGKSYFLYDLFTKVIFQEAGWASMDKKAVRRAQFLRYGSIFAILFLTVALSALWLTSYYENRNLVSATNAALAEYRTIAGPAVNDEIISNGNLHDVVGLLHKLRNLDVGYANRNQKPGWLETFGLSQRERLTDAGVEAYKQALERTFRPRLIYRLEQQIEAGMDDPALVYEALKVYLMLGGKAPKVDKDFIVTWMQGDWVNLYPGPANAAGRVELEEHLRAMLELSADRDPQIELNSALVRSAQQVLVRLSLADRAYSLIKSDALASNLPYWSFLDAGGPDTGLVFETVDGSPLEDLKIDGLFTYGGFNAFFMDQLSSVAERLSAESWVLGEAGTKAGVEAQLSTLGKVLLDKYRIDFVSQWQHLLDKVRLRRMSADKPKYEAIAAASSANSPIRNVVISIARETALATEETSDETKNAQASAPDGGIVSELAKAATKRVQDRATGWTRIGIDLALKKSQSRLGLSSSSERQLVPGLDVQNLFRSYQDLVNGKPGARQIDTLIGNLFDIYQSLVLAVTTPSQASIAVANLGVQVANLHTNASRLPTPFQRMMESAVTDFQGDAAGSTISQINSALNNEVTGFCQNITSNRYPFARSSQRDVQISEFAHLFSPNGIMDKFFAQHLTQYVDMSKSPWNWKADSKVGQGMSLATLREFERAADIRDAFFPAGGQLAGFSMVIRPNTLAGSAEMALLEINGTVVQSQQVGSAPSNLTWPSNGVGSASVTILPDIPGRNSAMNASGPWAFMRLLNMGRLSQQGDGLSVRFVVGGREVSYKIEVNSLKNPFVLPSLNDFKCPTGF